MKRNSEAFDNYFH